MALSSSRLFPSARSGVLTTGGRPMLRPSAANDRLAYALIPTFPFELITGFPLVFGGPSIRTRPAPNGAPMWTGFATAGSSSSWFSPGDGQPKADEYLAQKVRFFNGTLGWTCIQAYFQPDMTTVSGFMDVPYRNNQYIWRTEGAGGNRQNVRYGWISSGDVSNTGQHFLGNFDADFDHSRGLNIHAMTLDVPAATITSVNLRADGYREVVGPTALSPVPIQVGPTTFANNRFYFGDGVATDSHGLLFAAIYDRPFSAYDLEQLCLNWYDETFLPEINVSYFIPSAGGVLQSVMSMSFSSSPKLSGVGALQATIPLAFANSNKLSSPGPLSSTVTLTLGEAPALSGVGNLTSNADMSITPAAILTGVGSLVSAPALAFTLDGLLTDISGDALQSVCAMSFSTSAKLTGVGDLNPDPYYPQGANFFNDELKLSGTQSLSSNKTILCSVWFVMDDFFDYIIAVRDGSNVVFTINHGSNPPSSPTGGLSITLHNSAGTTIGQFVFPLNASTTTWRHLMFSVNLADENDLVFYLDGEDITATVQSYAPSYYTHTDDTINWAGADDWRLAHNNTIFQRWDGNIAEFYLTNEYLDLSVDSNRRKLRDVNGNPVNLGSDGASVTGTQPFLLLNNTHTTFQNNNGSAGDFSVTTGSLSALSPSYTPTVADLVKFDSAATLTGIGSLQSTSALALFPVTKLSSIGPMASTTALEIALDTLLQDNPNALRSSIVLGFTISAKLSAAGVLQSTTNLGLSVTPNLRGRAALQSNAALAFGAIPNLRGIAGLFSTSSLAFSTAVELSGIGSLQSSEPLGFVTDTMLSGIGSLQSNEALGFVVVPSLRGRASIASAITLAFGETAVIAGVGNLASNVSLDFDSTATLSGLGNLTSVLVLSLDATGTLSIESLDLSGLITTSLSGSFNPDRVTGVFDSSTPLTGHYENKPDQD